MFVSNKVILNGISVLEMQHFGYSHISSGYGAPTALELICQRDVILTNT
jgi:hypothetical protein